MLPSLLLVTTLFASAPAATSAGSFVDDFSRPSDAWRFGNAVLSGRGGLALGPHHAEATLAGTVISPENLRTFTATIDWSFGRNGKPVLIVGWGKPQEWSRIEECSAHFFVGREGRVTFMAGRQRLGSVELPPATDGVFRLKFRQEAGRLVVSSQGRDVIVPLPDGQTARAGYLMLRVQGLNAQLREEPLRMRRVEIEHSGQNAPLTIAQRNREIQAWAGQHLAANGAILERFAGHIQSETAGGRWGYKTGLSVEPGLVKPGEKVRVEFRTDGPVPTPCAAHVEPDFLSQTPGPVQPLELKWLPEGRGHVARVELTPQRPGNWRIVWQAGGEQLNRVLAVTGPGYTVCRMLITTHHGPWRPGYEPEAYDVIHDYGLSADWWDCAEWVSPFSRTPEGLLVQFGPLAAMHHRFGDRVMPLCNANWIIPGCPDNNLWRLDDSLQREGLQHVARLWEMLGLGRLEILGSYTFGHSTPRIARSLGVKMIDSLVQWQNWRDGGDDNAWLINQWGAPTVPYYVADDDFRKVAPGRSIVAFTQATTSSARMYYINTLEGQPQLSYLRRRPAADMAEAANIHRFQAAVDLWLAEAVHQPEPLFVSVGLENFVDSPDWNEANKRGVHYLRQQARQKKLVFTSSADIADYYQRHYAVQPENWLVWPDVYAGYLGGYKPRQVPDRIELSGPRFHSLHEDGAALPRCLWDFTRPWSEPVWDDQAAVRQKHGLVNPDLLTPENCVPRMESLEGIRAQVDVRPTPGGAEIAVRIDAARGVAVVPVAVWRVPLEPATIKVSAASAGSRYIPMVDGSTGNAHGVLVCEKVSPGANTWTVRLEGRPRAPLPTEVAIGPHVRGRAFYGESGPRVYLWLTEPKSPDGTLSIDVPAGRQVATQQSDGERQQSTGGPLRLVLDRAWQHESPLVTGLTPAELQSQAKFEPRSVR